MNMRVVCKDCDVSMRMYNAMGTRWDCPYCEIYIAIYVEEEE